MDRTPLTIKGRLVVAAIRLLRRAIRALPRSFMLGLCAAAGRLCGRFFRREREVARAQLEIAAARSQFEGGRLQLAAAGGNYDKLIDDVFAHTGRFAAEALLLDKLLELAPGESAVSEGYTGPEPPRFLHCTSEGEDIVYEIIRNKTGAVALSGHLGFIELLAAYHVACGAPLSVIGRLPNYSGLAYLIEEIRDAYGVQTIWRNDAGSAKKLRRVFAQGRFVAALIDQDTALENMYADFFGIPAAHPAAPIKLAIRYGLPILTSFIVRKGPLQHHIITERIDYDRDDPAAAQTVLNVFTRRLEKLVGEYPEQWFWWHRRWRRRPDVDYRAQPELLPNTEEYLRWLESSRSAAA